MAILIVDDERSIRKALSFALTKQSYETIEAKNAAEALELIEVQKFELIVIDYNLPVISGLDFIRLLKDDHKYYPTILLTSQEKLRSDIRSSNNMPDKIISKDLPLSRILKEIIEFLPINKVDEKSEFVNG